MTSKEFLANEELVKSWRETLATNQTLRLVLEVMEKESPIYGGINQNTSEAFALVESGFCKGYAAYDRMLRALATLPEVAQQMPSTYQPDPVVS